MCVNGQNIVPDYISLYPKSHQTTNYSCLVHHINKCIENDLVGNKWAQFICQLSSKKISSQFRRPKIEYKDCLQQITTQQTILEFSLRSYYLIKVQVSMV